jgi:HAD superfamily hydrolase (TIGR01509 family)
MKPLRAVLFDLGNVLIHYHPEEFWRVLGIPDAAEKATYRKQLTAILGPLERGESGFESSLDQLEKLFDGRYDRPRLVKAMESVLTTPIEEMEDIVRRVSEKIVTALVSNTNEFHFAYCWRVVPALKYLRKHFVSFKIGAMKPDPAFYEHVVKELKIQPQDMLFIDDIRENVDGAERVGMRGLVFQSPQLLEKDVRMTEILRV